MTCPVEIVPLTAPLAPEKQAKVIAERAILLDDIHDVLNRFDVGCARVVEPA
jgi:hypothetical protein